MTTRLTGFLHRNRWAWTAIAVVILWLVLSVISGRWSIASLSGILVSASFLTLVALGQMVVVTTGRGNIDLSVGAVITLSAFLSLLVIRGEDDRIWLGLLVTLGLGGAIGLANAFLVVRLRIPAIIATLATGYILASAALLANAEVVAPKISPAMRLVATGRIAGVPILTILTLVAVAVLALMLKHTVFGRRLSATGQSAEAARLAGVPVNRVLATAFVASATLASVTGLLLAAYVGGAFLELGQPYLLQSVAAVVLGGTLITGGLATAFGTYFAAILLILMVTIMQIMGLPRGTQDMAQGIAVILVLAFAARGPVRTMLKGNSRDAARTSGKETA